MYRIFVNYRRGTHSMSVAALAQSLAHHFGDDEVFLDVGIPSGEQYSGEIRNRLLGCDVLLAVIHDGWLETFGRTRWKDWVLYEIATALEKPITVIPVLLEDAKPPVWEELPEQIADLSLIQTARIRSAELRSDVDNLIRRIEHHIDVDDPVPPKERAGSGRKRTGLRIAGLAFLLFLVTPVLFFDAGPLWRMFALPAFASAALLALASAFTVVTSWSLRRVGVRLDRNAGRRSHREALSRSWLLPALLVLFTAFSVSRAMTQDGGWQEWEWWYVAVIVLVTVFYFHRWWRRTTEDDDAWPPPVSPDHWVFRRAALRLHDRLTTDKEWRHPRSRKTQRQAVSVYLDLAQARQDLVDRATIPVTRWIRNGYDGLTKVYLAWFTSVVLLDLAATAALVFGDPVRGTPFRVIAITLAGAAAFTAAMVTTCFLLDRYRVTRWIDELTEWQSRLGPLIFCANESAPVQTR
ncbi:TIR domain-containing protein [Actinophytocola oryzae]|uniref:TIR domain-containing protein n=1 Tax=Actinophytocola oryzae TaxID=502181 RepID=A0A4V3FV23_9PSEU|nr:TIR domain-containing protein [Actinophytocola oryzae]TDV57471.1 TIR domain-containing protein [Actinophytocola oryzae]